jgi:hypothetical protein
MGLISSGPFSFAQAQENADGDQTVSTEEVHDTQKLDKVLKDYNKDQKKVLQDAESIKDMETTGEISEEEFGKGKVLDPESVKELESSHEAMVSAFSNIGKKKKTPKDKKPKYSEVIKSTLAPLQKLSEEELVLMLKENTRESSAAKYVDHFPQIMLIAVRLIKDKDALPEMAKILDDQDKLIHYSGMMIATFLVGFLLRRFMAKEGRTIFVSLSLWFIRFLIMSGLRIAVTIFFFGEELTPAFKVLTRTIF